MKLFERETKVTVEDFEGLIQVVGYLNDQQHEMKSYLLIEPRTMIINQIKVEMIRVPYDICRNVEVKVEKLTGEVVKSGINKKVGNLLGGIQGCVHVNELLRESFNGAVQGNLRLMVQDMTERDMIIKLEKVLDNTCYRYIKENSITNEID